MERIAKCLCNEFQVIISRDPDLVAICHCRDCQRRSGNPWTGVAYFKKADAQLWGAHKIYTRAGQEGREVHNHFCPECGATVCWAADRAPSHYGIPVGSFNDPTFPAPSYSIWEHSMYGWVLLPPGIQHFPQGRPVWNQSQISDAESPRIPGG
jgi:hypothetical protein